MNRPEDGARFPWLIWGMLVLAATIAYLPSFQGAFIFDDLVWIVENEKLHSLSTLGDELAWNARPVIFLSVRLNYLLGGLNVFGYHLFNFAVHLAAGLLLFGLVRRTLRLPGLEQRYGRSADPLALAVALLWLVHPMQVQAVTYIIQRCESLMGMFYLLCLYCLQRASQSPKPKKWYAAGIAAGWIGMGCKEVMVTAPFVMLLYDRIFLSPSWKEVFRNRWKYYAAFVPAIVLLVVVTIGAAIHAGSGPDAPEGPSALAYLGSQPTVLLHYLRLAALPDKLCFDYQWPVVRDWREIVLPGLAVLGLLAASLAAFWVRPALGFLGTSFFLVLAPTSSFNPIADLAVEHRMYLPLAVLLVLAVVGFVSMVEVMAQARQRRAVLRAVVLLVVAMAWTTRTFVRNRLYTKPAAVWANVVAQAPRNARAHNNLGCCLSGAEQWDAAILEYRRAIDLNPQYPAPYCNLARALTKKDRPAEAASVLEHAVETVPRSELVHYELACLYETSGRSDEAIRQYGVALELNPRYGRAHYRLGSLLSRLGRQSEAIEHFQASLRERPGYSGSLFRLALAYQRSGEFGQAIEYYEQALAASPQLEKARRNIELCQQGKRNGEPLADEPEQRAGPRSTQLSKCSS